MKSDIRDKVQKFVPYLFFIVLFIGTVVTLRVLNLNHIYETKRQLGENAVLAMYDYRNVEQLDAQMTLLREMTTEEVFSQLTIDNKVRTLRVYYKFKQSSVHVNIIKSTDSYVLYSLDNENIDEDRIFMFIFDIDGGKISYVREEECIDFVTTLY